MGRKLILFFAVSGLIIILSTVAMSMACACFENIEYQSLPILEIDKVYNVSEVGQTVLVNVTLRDVPSTLGCHGWQLRLTWDPCIARLPTVGPYGAVPERYVVLTEGPFLRSAGPTLFIINSVDNDQGEAIVGAILEDSRTSASGTGVILTMNFTIIQVGTTAIELHPPSPALNQSVVVDAANHLVDHIEINGWISEREPRAHDAIVLTLAFNAVPSSSKWDPAADLNSDDIVDIFDAIILASHYGEKTVLQS